MNLDTVEPLIQKKFGKFKKSKGNHGIDYIVKCPFCRKPDKMYLTPIRELYHCFRCGKAGSLSDLIGQVAALQQQRPQLEVIQPLPTNIEPPGTLLPLTALEFTHPAIQYIRWRKFDPQELNDVFGVRYCVAGKTYARKYDTTNTLIFPMWMFGKLVGWQSRLLYTPDDMTEDECSAFGFPVDDDGDYVKPPKYWTSPGLQKGRVFFNFDWARQSEVVVVCEGTFDAMAVGKCGVAGLGKGITDYQMRLLAPYWKVVVILLDPGDADNEMEKMDWRLSRALPTVQVQLKGYKDAGEAPRKEIWMQIGEAAWNRGIDILKYKVVI